MYRIEKKFTFAGGHRLSKHQGLCKNIHGHNYTVYVGIKAEKLNENDMVMDFSDLKIICKKYFEKYDHCLIVNKKDAEWMKPLVDKMGWKATIMDHKDRDPTAEVMSEEFYNFLKEIFKPFPGIEVDYITVYENENSKATYSED